MQKTAAVLTAMFFLFFSVQLALTSPATEPFLTEPFVEKVLNEQTIGAGIAWIAGLVVGSRGTEDDFTKTIDKYGFVQVALQYHWGVIGDRIAEETSVINKHGEREMDIPAYNGKMKLLVYQARVAWATTSAETLWTVYKVAEPVIVEKIFLHRVFIGIAYRDLVKMRAHLADPRHHAGAEDTESDFSHKLIDRRLGEVREATQSEQEVQAKLQLMRRIVQNLISALEKRMA